MKAKNVILMGSVFVALSATAWSQRQLQDNFGLEKRWSLGTNLVNQTYQAYGIAVDSSNRTYVATGGGIRVFDAGGAALTNWSIASAWDVFFDSTSNQIVVCSASANNQIRFYDAGLNLIRQWGTNSLTTPYGVAVGMNGLVYVADYGHNRIQVFDQSGNWTNQWGQTGTAGGEFSGIYDVTVGADGTVFVPDYNNMRVQRFTPAGGFVGQYAPVATWNPRTVAASVDGLVCGASYPRDVRVMSLDPTYLYNLGFGSSEYIQGAAFAPDGQRLYLLGQTEVRVFRRGYRTFGLIPPNALPLPVVLSCAQRVGTTWVDVDFSVIDPDNTNVTVATIALIGGRTDLGAVVKMNTFTNDTTILLPTNLTTGVKYHLTWDIGVDFPTNFFYVKVNILAKDNRGLMDFHFLTLPPDATYTNTLLINRTPIQQNDFLGVWTWMVATGDTNVTLQAGNLYGTGANSNKLYAQTTSTNTTTTSDGRAFLFSLLNVREATSAEVYRARIGTTGRITQWVPRNKIGSWPQKINEFGFDTSLFNTNNPAQGVTNAWWVVPLP